MDNLFEYIQENKKTIVLILLILCLLITVITTVQQFTNVKKPINKQHLMECLEKYFEKNPNVPTDDIVKYILENRPTNVKEGIRHKPPKNI